MCWLRITRSIHGPRPDGPSHATLKFAPGRFVAHRQSHRYLCPWGITSLPPLSNSNYFGYISVNFYFCQFLFFSLFIIKYCFWPGYIFVN
ncbi:hypothetical protein FYE06_20115, partial [Salmonella enterica]|nr:hypothetical protein [Salmonella enterica]